MIYVICFLAVIIAFCFFTRKFRNVWKLHMVFGKKGSGKSTFLIRQAIKYQKKGYTIYTNMIDCTLAGVFLINVDDLGDFIPEPNSVLLLDEVGMIWDARDFKKFKASVRDFFKLQRHYHVICYLASQTFDIDKKLRDLCDSMVLFTNLFNVFSLGRPIQKKIVLTESTSEAESRISENLKFLPVWNWQLLYIPKYIKFFNSYHVPDMPKLPYTVVEGEPFDSTPKLVKSIIRKKSALHDELNSNHDLYLSENTDFDKDNDKAFCILVGIVSAFGAAGLCSFFMLFF